MFRRKRALFILLVTLMVWLVTLPALAQKQKVTLWALDATNYRLWYDPLLKEFGQEYPNINLEVSWFPYKGFGEKIQGAFFAGLEPDIIDHRTEYLMPMVAAGLIEPVPEDRFAKYIEDLYPVVKQLYSHKDKLMGLSFTNGLQSGVLVYNEDLLREAGVDVVATKTWEQLMRAGQKLTKKDAEGKMIQAGYTVQSQPWRHWVMYALQFGGEIMSADGKRAVFNNSAGEKALQLIEDIYDKWQICDVKFGQYATQWGAGRIAFLNIGPWFGRISSIQYPDIKFGFHRQPQLSTYPLHTPVPVEHGHFVTRRCKNKDAAWTYVEFMSRPKSCVAICVNTPVLSPFKSIDQMPQIKEHPWLSPYVPLKPYMKLIYDVRGGRFYEVLDQMVMEVLFHRKTVKQSLADAEKQLNDWFVGFDEEREKAWEKALGKRK